MTNHDRVFKAGFFVHWKSTLLQMYLKPLLNSFFYHCTSRQPRWLVELQTVQELLSDHLHGLPETLLQKINTYITKFKWSIKAHHVLKLMFCCKYSILYCILYCICNKKYYIIKYYIYIYIVYWQQKAREVCCCTCCNRWVCQADTDSALNHHCCSFFISVICSQAC